MGAILLTDCKNHRNDPGWPNLSARAYSFSLLNTLHFNISAWCVSSETGIYSLVVKTSKLDVRFEESTPVSSIWKKGKKGFTPHSSQEKKSNDVFGKSSLKHS